MRMSVVVPTLRRVEDLRRCLAALARQTRPADRIIVVVHDSDAATQEALAAWRAACLKPEVSTTIVRSRGLPAALNAGLDAVDGDDVVCFTDDDAEPWPDWLARIENHYRDASVGAVGGRDRRVADGGTAARCSQVGRVFWYGRYVGNHHLELHPPVQTQVDALTGVNMSYRTSALRGFRFDERLCTLSGSCTELDAGFFLKRGGWRLIYDPAVGVNHRLSARTWGVARSHPGACYDFSHNYTYVILKHTSWPRRLCSLAYFALVGQRQAWGLLTILVDSALTGQLRWRGQLGPTLRGRIAGIQSYLASRRASGPAR